MLDLRPFERDLVAVNVERFAILAGSFEERSRDFRADRAVAQPNVGAFEREGRAVLLWSTACQLIFPDPRHCTDSPSELARASSGLTQWVA